MAWQSLQLSVLLVTEVVEARERENKKVDDTLE